MDWPAPLTVRELSAELGCSEDEVRALIREGELRTVACGIRPGLVPRHEFDAYLRRLRHRVPPERSLSSIWPEDGGEPSPGETSAS
jgi:excisionase family DNA binding protein